MTMKEEEEEEKETKQKNTAVCVSSFFFACDNTKKFEWHIDDCPSLWRNIRRVDEKEGNAQMRWSLGDGNDLNWFALLSIWHKKKETLDLVTRER